MNHQIQLDSVPARFHDKISRKLNPVGRGLVSGWHTIETYDMRLPFVDDPNAYFSIAIVIFNGILTIHHLRRQI